MAYDYGDKRNTKKASRLLRELLPEAREIAKNPDAELRSTSGIGDVSTPYLRIGNVRGVHLYQGDHGGWYADIELRSVPPGIARILGTPTHQPDKSAEDARRTAIFLLGVAIRNEASVELSDTTKAAFAWDEVEIIVPTALVAKIQALGAGPHDLPGLGWMKNRLDELRRDINGGRPFTKASLDALPRETFLFVFNAAAMALAHGMVRWPETKPENAPPSVKVQ